MTDDRGPDAEFPSELASAYLDGEVTADERAVVEGDPALLAEVDRLRRLRDKLAQAPQAPAATRDAAIAAAMAVFDESPGDVIDLAARRKTRWIQGLSAAAAVAIVAAGAVVIATRDGDEGGVAVQDAAVPATTEPAATAAEAAPPIAGSDSLSQLVPTTTLSAPAAAPAAPPTTTAAIAADEAAEPPPVVRDATDLAELSGNLDTAPPSLDVVVDRCENASVPPDAIYVTDDGEEIDVVVASTADGYAAVSLADCTVVLETES